MESDRSFPDAFGLFLKTSSQSEPLQIWPWSMWLTFRVKRRPLVGVDNHRGHIGERLRIVNLHDGSPQHCQRTLATTEHVGENTRVAMINVMALYLCHAPLLSQSTVLIHKFWANWCWTDGRFLLPPAAAAATPPLCLPPSEPPAWGSSREQHQHPGRSKGQTWWARLHFWRNTLSSWSSTDFHQMLRLGKRLCHHRSHKNLELEPFLSQPDSRTFSTTCQKRWWLLSVSRYIHWHAHCTRDLRCFQVLKPLWRNFHFLTRVRGVDTLHYLELQQISSNAINAPNALFMF